MKMSSESLRDLKKEGSLFLTRLVPLQIVTHVGEPKTFIYFILSMFKNEILKTNLVLIEKATLKDETCA